MPHLTIHTHSHKLVSTAKWFLSSFYIDSHWRWMHWEKLVDQYFVKRYFVRLEQPEFKLPTFQSVDALSTATPWGAYKVHFYTTTIPNVNKAGQTQTWSSLSLKGKVTHEFCWILKQYCIFEYIFYVGYESVFYHVITSLWILLVIAFCVFFLF